MGKSLYRSYRSTSFDEILGQDHIVQVLKNSIASNSLSHAYLLSGPRGTGKTSVARILAYAANNQVYRSEETNLDIIEIDAASNRRIDEIREIKERVHIAPLQGKYKIYIVDEVHMLTKEAFNALLKTLEEPPNHVIFILATTEFHKVPETIVSRCVRLTFKPISEHVIAKHLETIAKKENIDISAEALAIIAKHGRGSFRDAISLLDQIKSLEGTIDTEMVQSMLGLTSVESCQSILDATLSGDLPVINELLSKLTENGIQAGSLASQLSELIRRQITDTDLPPDNQQGMIQLLQKLLDVPSSTKPNIALELALYGLAISVQEHHVQPEEPHSQSPQVASPDTNKQVEPTPVQPAAKLSDDQPDSTEQEAKPVAHTEPSKKVIAAPITPNSSPSTANFEDFLKELKNHNNTLYGVARMAQANFEGNQLSLSFKFAFHYKQLTDSKNLNLVTGVVKKIYGDKAILSVTMIEKEKPATNIEESLDTVASIFGGHEVLEG